MERRQGYSPNNRVPVSDRRQKFLLCLLEEHGALSSRQLASIFKKNRFEGYSFWSTSDISKIIRVLKRRELVKTKIRGTTMFYELTTSGLAKALQDGEYVNGETMK